MSLFYVSIQNLQHSSFSTNGVATETVNGNKEENKHNSIAISIVIRAKVLDSVY